MLLLLVSLVTITSFISLEKKLFSGWSSFFLIILYVVSVFVIGCRFGVSDYGGYLGFYNNINNSWEIGLFKTKYLETFYVLLALFEKNIFGKDVYSIQGE